MARKDEEKILERTFDTMDSNISVYFSLHQAECGSQSEAAELGLQLESIQVLRIPQLTAIESRAFAASGCGVAKLLIPDSVKIIGPNAFRNCALSHILEVQTMTHLDDVSFGVKPKDGLDRVVFYTLDLSTR